ncbi:hypothetical protein RhiJN_08875 [Ceratobasidium sp. AG-Ba]|nr:hypothetical protein RhiJN_08875 [Ceratobasidium sp. AG-Ba]
MSLQAYIEFIDSNPPPLHVLVDVMYTLHPNLPSTFRTPFAAFGHAIQYVHDCQIDYLIWGGEAAKTLMSRLSLHIIGFASESIRTLRLRAGVTSLVMKMNSFLRILGSMIRYHEHT